MNEGRRSPFLGCVLASEVFCTALTLGMLVSCRPCALAPFPSRHHPVAMHKEIIDAEIMICRKGFSFYNKGYGTAEWSERSGPVWKCSILYRRRNIKNVIET